MRSGGRPVWVDLAVGVAAAAVVVGCGSDPAALDATGAAPGDPGSTVEQAADRSTSDLSSTDPDRATGGSTDAGARPGEEPNAESATAVSDGPASFPTGIEPARLAIPALDLDADVIGLTLSGPEPEVPSDFAQTGWYHQTREPGEIGPAVIAGHIDSVDGPAVFARLDELVAGDEILVEADGGERRRFVVTGSGQYPKGDLPAEVFGFGEPEPELRLITCGGTFDRASGHYRDNYVVYAALDE